MFFVTRYYLGLTLQNSLSSYQIQLHLEFWSVTGSYLKLITRYLHKFIGLTNFLDDFSIILIKISAYYSLMFHFPLLWIIFEKINVMCIIQFSRSCFLHCPFKNLGLRFILLCSLELGNVYSLFLADNLNGLFYLG